MESKPHTDPFFLEARRSFHKALLDSKILTTSAAGMPSIADKDSKTSVMLAEGILQRLGNTAQGARLAGQMSGSKFEVIVGEFLEETFLKLSPLRPGCYKFLRGDSRLAIAGCEQYEHLKSVSEAVKGNQDLAAALGRDYIIKPDIIVVREPEPDTAINKHEFLVNPKVAERTPLRSANSELPILHASVSCKWTLRSDRAQNARSEALNLIRNRKGPLPHVVVATAEPMPSRLASLALGTGDIDCVYHIALTELIDAVEQSERDDSREMLSTMTEGKRLRDIADLPFDLAA